MAPSCPHAIVGLTHYAVNTRSSAQSQTFECSIVRKLACTSRIVVQNWRNVICVSNKSSANDNCAVPGRDGWLGFNPGNQYGACDGPKDKSDERFPLEPFITRRHFKFQMSHGSLVLGTKNGKSTQGHGARQKRTVKITVLF